MGNNSSLFNITFDRTQPTIYYCGDTISGRVQFTVSERTNNIDDMYLTVTGDIGYTTTRRRRIQNGQTELITDRHDIRIFGEKISLNLAKSVQQERTNNGINEIKILEAGQYTYPFSVRLPDTLPPTLHPKDYPFVRYELQLFIEKKWYCSNTRHRHPLRIYPRVNLLQIINSRRSLKFDTKQKDITVIGILQHSGLVPGEQTILSLEISNPNRLAIKRVDVCLIQRYEIEQCRRRLELIRLAVPQLFDNNNERIRTTCPMTIPAGIPPSYNFKSKGDHSGVHVNIHYDLKLEVKAKGLFSDFDLQVPVIIGTDSTDHSNPDGITRALATPMDLNAIDILELEAADDGLSSTT